MVVEDVVTTGGSVKEVISLIKELGGEVTAVAVLVDRSGGEVDFQVPTYSLLDLQIESYFPEECPYANKAYLQQNLVAENNQFFPSKYPITPSCII